MPLAPPLTMATLLPSSAGIFEDILYMKYCSNGFERRPPDGSRGTRAARRGDTRPHGRGRRHVVADLRRAAGSGRACGVQSHCRGRRTRRPGRALGAQQPALGHGELRRLHERRRTRAPQHPVQVGRGRIRRALGRGPGAPHGARLPGRGLRGDRRGMGRRALARAGRGHERRQGLDDVAHRGRRRGAGRRRETRARAGRRLRLRHHLHLGHDRDRRRA